MSVFSFSHLLTVLLICISLAVRFSTSSIQGNETDRLALLAFKSQIILDPYNVTGSWNDSHHFCEWEGVVCSQRHQRVTVLRLMSKGLVGYISPHFGNLSFLRTLRLFHNGFQGEIPQELGHLFRLEDLSLSNNSLVGKIPANISRCSNLINLYCAHNKLVGHVPMELGYLTKLVIMALDNNKLTGEIPLSLGNLTSLEALSVSYNNLVGSIPSTFGQLKRLKIFEVISCKLFGTFPPFLYNLSTLEVISIQDNHLSGKVLNEIGILLPNLKWFFVSVNQFSGPIPTSLFNATKLQKLDISYNQFSGSVPPNAGNLKELTDFLMQNNSLGSGKSGDLDFFSSLTNCSNLQTLRMNANRFGGVLPASVANFSSQFSQLYLGENQISGNIPDEVGHLQNLTFLNLNSNFLTGSIPMGIGNLKNLRVLTLHINQLSGQIPSSITYNLSRLHFLDLSNNMLEGSIASSLANQKLKILDLSYNNFTGAIPKQEIGLSSRLVVLILSHNSLDGSIPFEIGSLKNLEYVNVSENKLVGEIPSTLGSCSSLEYLYLQGNFFQGPLPSQLGDLKGLQVLDVSRNNISGNIPKELQELSLQRLNLSFNNLEGEVPIQGIFQNASAVSVVGNYKICGGILKLKLPKCKTQKRNKLPLALKVTLGVLIPSIMVAVFLLTYLWKQPKSKIPSEHVCEDLTHVSYNDLHKATNGFSSENLIGAGSYGYVYKGILHHSEGFIAVKVLDLLRQGASKSFMAECESLGGVRHRNLLKILTVCSSVDSNGNDFKAIVFNFMPNGSLDSWLHPSSNGQHLPYSLNLYRRLSIAIDVASALDYLHNYCERPIIHCDLKSNNVLLSDDMTAHVADFGVAKLMSNRTNTSNKTESDYSIALRGTIGYIPPEYGMSSEVSKQGDTYSYGILLLEMLTGKRPTDHMFKDGLSLRDYSRMALPLGVMDIVDMRMLSKAPQNGTASSRDQINESLSSMVRIGLACSEEIAVERMDIKDVLKELNSIKEGLSHI